MNIRQTLQSASSKIAPRDAEVLMSMLLVKDRAWIRAHDDVQLSASEQDLYRDLVERRIAGEPLQYITGVQEFFGLSLHVGPGVLIPRPETEHLVEAVCEWAAASRVSALKAIDVGTGSGAIAIALAKSLPDLRITAVDTSEDALVIAKRNAKEHGLTDRVCFEQKDLLDGVSFGSVDVVVSNPPYVSLSDALDMQREVVLYEPHTALFGGEDGLEVYRRLVPQAHSALRGGGLLAMEFGWGQQTVLRNLLDSWDHVRFQSDYAGIPRIVLAERRSS